MKISSKLLGALGAAAVAATLIVPANAGGTPLFEWKYIKDKPCYELRPYAKSFGMTTYTDAYNFSYKYYKLEEERWEDMRRKGLIDYSNRWYYERFKEIDFDEASDLVARRYVECGAVRDDSKRNEKGSSNSSGSSFASLSS